jgi:hypothetical protein
VPACGVPLKSSSVEVTVPPNGDNKTESTESMSALGSLAATFRCVLDEFLGPPEAAEEIYVDHWRTSIVICCLRNEYSEDTITFTTGVLSKT